MQTSEKLSNEELIQNILRLVREERERTNQVVLHFAELDRRRLYADLGYRSLFDYATRGLKYSRMAAQRRIVAARVIKFYPASFEELESGNLSLEVMGIISEVIKPENAERIVTMCCGKTPEEARALLVEKRVCSVVRSKDRIEPLRLQAASEQEDRFNSDKDTSYSRCGSNYENDRESAYRVSFNASEELKGKLEEARKLIFGLSKEGTMENVLDEVLEHYLRHARARERAERLKEKRLKRIAKAEAKRAKAAEESKENLVKLSTELSEILKRVPSAALRGEVLERDDYRCSYVAPDGTRCECSDSLEIDHILPFAAGGRTELSNLRVLCRAHNQLHARRYFGERYIERRASGVRGAGGCVIHMDSPG